MQITSGPVKQPYFIVVYGENGSGKTSFAAGSPSPFFIDLEKGSLQQSVDRTTGIETFEQLLEGINWLKTNDHKYQTVVIDTLDFAEAMIWRYVCERDGGKQSIEDVGGGFQKGYLVAIDQWRRLINSLHDLRAHRKMNIIAIAHEKITTVNDPMQTMAYDRHTLKLHENKQVSANALWRETADAVLFAAFEDTVFKVNTRDKKAKASGEGTRKLYTTRDAAYDAKNRFGLPSHLSLDYDAFARALELGEPDSLENIKKDLETLGAELEKQNKPLFERMSVGMANAKDDVKKLLSIRNYARTIVESN